MSMELAGKNSRGPVRNGRFALYNSVKCKAMPEATLSAKNQIVIPKEAREALGLRAGDRLLIVVRGSRVVVLQKPESHHRAIRGVAKEVYPDGYLGRERQSWD